MNFSTIMIVVMSLLLLFILGVVGYVLQHRATVGREKSSAYECGLDPNMSARIPFSLRFFLLAVIFLVLDVEIALLMGVPVTFGLSFVSSAISASALLVVLVIGLFHEWREGSLNWM